MTPEEKWKRLTNPTTADDYGISLTTQEFESFDEGRKVLSVLRTASKDDGNQEELMRRMAANSRGTFERVLHDLLSVEVKR